MAVQLRGSHFGVTTHVSGKRDRHMPRRGANGPQCFMFAGAARPTGAAGAIRVGTDNCSRRVTVVASERVRYTMGYNVAGSRILMLMRMRVPPQHELLNDEEHAKSNDHRDTDRVRAAGSNRFHRLGQQPQQRGADQSAGGEAHEVRQHPQSGLLREQQKEAREGGARNTADRGEHDYPAEKGHGLSAFVTPSLTF
jgi:hypothetical protein